MYGRKLNHLRFADDIILLYINRRAKKQEGFDQKNFINTSEWIWNFNLATNWSTAKLCSPYPKLYFFIPEPLGFARYLLRNRDLGSQQTYHLLWILIIKLPDLTTNVEIRGWTKFFGLCRRHMYIIATLSSS